MSGMIRLACMFCDRMDFDGVAEIPHDWVDVDEVRSYEEAYRPVAVGDLKRSVLDWETHVGVCPECNIVHRWSSVPPI